MTRQRLVLVAVVVVLAIGVVLILGPLRDSSTPSSEGGGLTVTADEFGSNWPFTVDTATLHCELAVDAPIPSVQVGGQRYALTSLALSVSTQRRLGWRKLTDETEVWKESPAQPGTKVLTTAITQRALTLCSG